MTDTPPPSRGQSDPDVWVDFNDIEEHDRLTALQAHANVEIIGGGQTLWVGDGDGNRCGAIVLNVQDGIAHLRLVLDTFEHARIQDLVVGAPLSPGERVRGGIRYENRPTMPLSDPERVSMAQQMIHSVERVHALGSQHIDPLRTDHAERVTGCPWCVDETLARHLFERLRDQWPDQWSALHLYEARVLCARGDLARSGS